VCGGVLIAASVCLGVFFLIVPFFAQANALATNTAVLSFATILALYGALLLLLERALHTGRWREPLRLPSPYLLLGAYFLALAVGQVVLIVNLVPAFLFPVWHILASLLFPLAILSFAARRLDACSTRSALAQFTWGGLVTIGSAFVLELALGGIVALLALLGLAVVLGQDTLGEIARALTQTTTDAERAIELLFQYPVAAIIAGGAAFGLIVVLVPLMEELLKAAGVAILVARRVRAHFLPTRGNALLWGLAAGAGYAFSENMLNGQSAVSDPNGFGGFWAGAMLLRAGTSLMHMLTTATVAVGWYEALVARRPMRLLLLLGAAALGHALWNSFALVLAGAMTARTTDTPFASASTLLTGVAASLLGLLFVGSIFWLRALLQWARRRPNFIST